MNLGGLREALRKQPFEPFTVRLADGRTELVKHPECIAMGPGTVVVVRDDGSWLSIEPLLIDSLDFEAPREKRGNGSPKKRRPNG
jgi:hypothetical protein